jgi:prolyl oligopeptidase
VASIGGLSWHPSRGDSILFSSETFGEPRVYYRHDPRAKAATVKTALQSIPAADLGDVEVRREFATSKDGTKVPLNIVMRRGTKLDGKSPCIATGYGGYGNSLEPRHRTRDAIGLEQGVIFVVANLRGGGEYGEQWHLQGNLTNKQNVFDDFAAVLTHLIDRGYTSSDRLAIVGGSNGGLLMGALLTQHPDLVKAVVSYVGIYDQLRTELSPNGEFNITEFGTVKIKEQFEAMYAYSPYHHVVDGTKYPATLFHAGSNDPRVEPWQSRKMTAALQHAQKGDAPILLRTDSSAGHGGSTKKDERVEQTTQVWAFFFDQLGVTYTPR